MLIMVFRRERMHRDRLKKLSRAASASNHHATDSLLRPESSASSALSAPAAGGQYARWVPGWQSAYDCGQTLRPSFNMFSCLLHKHPDVRCMVKLSNLLGYTQYIQWSRKHCTLFCVGTRTALPQLTSHLPCTVCPACPACLQPVPAAP
jgi:hypothetical protein